MHSGKVLAIVLAVTIISSLTATAHAALTITLTPNSGPPGTHVTISGSEPDEGAPTLNPICQISSNPNGLISSPTCTMTQDAQGDYTVAGSFVVAAGAAGEFTVSVTVFRSDDGLYESGSAFFDANGGGPVGGVVMPLNTFAILGPWLAVIGLVSCIGTAVAVVAKKRRP